MKDIDKTLSTLGKIWKKYPELRLGQLIINAAPSFQVLFYIDDARLINLLAQRYNVDLTENNKERAGKETGTQNKNRVYIHKNNEVKAVKQEDLQKYLDNGFKIGKK